MDKNKNRRIMTAQEFLEKFENERPILKALVSDGRESFYSSAQGYGVTLDVMVEFAKYHVTQALKMAAYNAKTGLASDKIFSGTPTMWDVEIDKDSILNAYPLENIK